MLIRNATLQMSATERACMDVRVMNGCVWEMGAALVKGLYESEIDLRGDVLMPGRMLETPISAADEKGGEHTEYGCQQKREEQRRETAVHAVYPRNARRKEHKGRIEQQYGTDVFQYQSGPHFGSVFFRSTNSSIISLSPSISSSLLSNFGANGIPCDR